jgi:hypothetical protein
VVTVALAEYYVSVLGQLNKTLGRSATLVDALPVIAIPAVLTYLVPIFLSVVLTRYHPAKMVVPPLFMQLVSFGLVVIFAYNFYQTFGLVLYFVAFEYVIVGGLSQDLFARLLLGRMGSRSDILTASLVIRSRLDDVVGVLSNEKYSRNMNLGKRIHKSEGRAVFVSPKKYETVTALELKRSHEDNETFVNVATFEKEKFYITRTDESDEWNRATVAYLKDILSRQDPPITVTDAPQIGGEALANEILDEIKGISSPWQMRGWVSLLAFLVPIFIAAAFFFELRDYTDGYVTLALTAPYLAIEAPRVLGRKSD